MRVQRGSVLVGAAACLLAWAATAMAETDIQGNPTGKPDVDVRTGRLAPTKAQRSDVADLQAQAGWNQFGTPSSLVRPGAALGASVGAASAADAARAWLSANRSLYRLSSLDGLTLVADNKLADSDTHAITLRQTVGGLAASGGGLVTLGVAKSGDAWKIVSATGSISGDESLSGKVRLRDGEAWQRAAASVGRVRSLAQIERLRARKLRLGHGWHGLRVAGLGQVQQARQVAFPTVSKGFVPAYETLVVDGETAEPSSYRVFVDARNGAILARDSLVDSASDAPQPAKAKAAQAPAPGTVTTPVSGTLPPEDGGCDERKGPFTVGDGARALDVFVNSDMMANDLVLHVFNATTEIPGSPVDTGTTPERIRFSPTGGVPPGDYFIQVCEFGDGTPPGEPRTYTGTVTIDTSVPPASYLARWRAFPANPPLNPLAFDPWNNPSDDTRVNMCWRQSTTASDCDMVVGNQASRAPWDFSPRLNAPTNTTAGNNARSAESWLNSGGPGPNQFQPVSPIRDYTFPWTNEWFTKDCDPGTPYGANFVVGKSFDVSAAAVNLFTVHNQMHDFSYLLGFTEQNWNGQESNFGLTESFQENDPVLGDVQAGAALPPPGVYGNARNNANMATAQDGTPSTTNMYLWQPVAGGFYPPCVDGDFDAGVIGHEYGHMIENRMIGKGLRRSGFHAGSMGEAFGDLVSIERLQESGFVPTDDENPFATGTYVTGNKLRGIRNYAPNFPSTGAFPTPGVYPQVDPLNFSDIGYDVTGPEVHADGEIWVAINYELRKALNAKYDGRFPSTDGALQAGCAKGEVPLTQCPGNRRWIQDYFDAMLLMPTNPSMIDARNAILAADTARFGGANVPTLQAAFARRGLGAGAGGDNTTGRAAGVESDTNPLPDFANAAGPNANVTFAATSTETGSPAVKARIYVGHYEARVSPVADTDPATDAPAGASLNNLDATAAFAPGTYEFIATAPGYGAVRFRKTFRANTAPTINLTFAPNFASANQGATASGDVAAVPSVAPTAPPVLTEDQVLRNLIDDTEASDWQTEATQDADGAWNVDGKQVTVDLAGTRPQTIRHVQVSAQIGPVFDAAAGGDQSQNRFTALRQFEIWTCNDQAADCSTDDGYQRAFASGTDAFPADAPRPVVPMLLLRDFTFSPVRATHLRIVVRNSQCTGGPAYQGEQDADPFNATDCNSAGPASTHFVRIAEVQAFNQQSRAQG
jgi:extracellular elastinolytic metalloproteinase